MVNFVLEEGAPHHEVVGGCGDDEPRRNRETRLEQFAQVRGFAATAIEIPGPKLRQINDQHRSVAVRHRRVFAPQGAILLPAPVSSQLLAVNAIHEAEWGVAFTSETGAERLGRRRFAQGSGVGRLPPHAAQR